MTAAPEVTYAGIGRTRGELPEGYHHVRRSAVIGADSVTLTVIAFSLNALTG